MRISAINNIYGSNSNFGAKKSEKIKKELEQKRVKEDLIMNKDRYNTAFKIYQLGHQMDDINENRNNLKAEMARLDKIFKHKNYEYNRLSEHYKQYNTEMFRFVDDYEKGKKIYESGKLEREMNELLGYYKQEF